jgi:hypothetical protein
VEVEGGRGRKAEGKEEEEDVEGAYDEHAGDRREGSKDGNNSPLGHDSLVYRGRTVKIL